MARTVSNVSIYFAAVGDLAQAAQLIARQAEIMQQAGNLVGQAVSLANLGYYYLMLGRYASASATLEQALTLSEVIGARRERLYTQLNLALACWRTGDGERARRLLRDAIRELEAVGDAYASASGQIYLGLVLQEGGENAAAEASLSQAQRTMEVIGVRGSATDALAGLLRCRIAQGNLRAVRATVEAVWAYLSAGLAGMEFALLAYETCARAFDMLDEHDSAAAAASAGYAVLMDQANFPCRARRHGT